MVKSSAKDSLSSLVNGMLMKMLTRNIGYENVFKILDFVSADTEMFSLKFAEQVSVILSICKNFQFGYF